MERCAQSHEPSEDEMMLMLTLILIPLVTAGSLTEELTRSGASRLSHLLVEAGLEDLLSSEGPWTILAPRDEAFARVPSHVLTELSSDPGQLKKVLLYHVIKGDVPISSLENNALLQTVQGSSVLVNVYLQSQYYEAVLPVTQSSAHYNITSGLHHTQWPGLRSGGEGDPGPNPSVQWSDTPDT